MQIPLFIATAINEAYLLPLRVMLVSLKAHLNPSYRPVLFLFNTRLGAEQLKTIAALVETQSIVPSPAVTSMLPRSSRFIAETAFPLLLSDLLPESLERVLFLDADMLVLDDIARIWETDISNSSVAAVVDQAIPLCSSPRGVKDRSSLGIPDSAPYFNAGVMLINLTRWRRLNIPARASEYFHRMSGQDGLPSSRSAECSLVGQLASARSALESRRKPYGACLWSVQAVFVGTAWDCAFRRTLQALAHAHRRALRCVVR